MVEPELSLLIVIKIKALPLLKVSISSVPDGLFSSTQYKLCKMYSDCSLQSEPKVIMFCDILYQREGKISRDTSLRFPRCARGFGFINKNPI